eukprot:5409432-Heterocapsa_arctica.AAC.1
MSDRGEGDWLELLRERHLAPAIGAVIQPENIPVPDGGEGEWVRKLVDLKGVAKPPEFGGEDKDWYEWKFRFSSTMSLLGILPAMQYCADLPYQIKLEALS